MHDTREESWPNTKRTFQIIIHFFNKKQQKKTLFALNIFADIAGRRNEKEKKLSNLMNVGIEMTRFY